MIFALGFVRTFFHPRDFYSSLIFFIEDNELRKRELIQIRTKCKPYRLRSSGWLAASDDTDQSWARGLETKIIQLNVR